LFQGLLRDAGLPADLLAVLDDDKAAASAAITAGVDKLVLTGSAATGAAVLTDLAPHLTPAVMELSGSDAVFVLPGADLDRVAAGLAFGLRLNGSSTCIAPRRVLAPPALLAQIEARLLGAVAAIPAVPVPASVIGTLRPVLQAAQQAGARLLGALPEPDRPMAPVLVADARPEMALLQADVFAPVLSLVAVDDGEAALAADALCPYALGASIFGPEPAARTLAAQVRAASVTVNDIIAPTGDPRLPFGGRHRSGFGVTRGAEGLLAMTTVKAVSVRRGGAMPYLDPPRPGDDAVLAAMIDLLHGGGIGPRLRAVPRLWAALRRR
jgi:acyl-CoA reductase-like NAD-dependent aldehyde dehydrogenase